MPISDKKKAQHLIDVVADEVVKLKASADRLAAVRQAYQDQNVDPARTALEGHEAEASAWVDSVVAVANSVVANAFVANKSVRHRPASALGEKL